MAAIARPAAAAPIATPAEIIRFDLNQRIQHVIMMTSFILLAATGIPLKFSEFGAAEWWISLWGGLETTRAVHHFFAWAMVLDCVYHLIYVGYSVLGQKKPLPVSMIPSLKDIKDFYSELAYLFGLKVKRPLYDRFNWREKFDYWAIFWGMFIIGGSGAVLMFPVLATRFFPGWIVPAALVAHGDEAMLAIIWIMIVHIFFNHFSPVSFPINKTIFTGKISEEQLKEEHPLEFKRLRPEKPATDLPHPLGEPADKSGKV